MSALGQLLLLVVAEVEKPQCDTSRAIKQHYNHHWASCAHYRRVLNRTFKQNTLAGSAAANRVNTGSVLVTDWQVEQQVCDLVDAKRREFFGELWTNTPQVSYRRLLLG